MSVATGIPKGTRDFSPLEMNRRKFIFSTLEEVFRLYGFLPIETPAMELLSTLTGKYGEEGDRLIFKILNSGDFLADVNCEDLKNESPARLASQLCEKALRYDLTVPFARFVVQHKSDITFPFKRYQIQPVWRADRPQRGRYREFFQCDVDVIGTHSLLCEVELMQIIDDVFGKLGISVRILINNRKVLTGIAEAIGHGDKFTDMTTAIDKLDKIGREKVKEELVSKGIEGASVDKLLSILEIGGSPSEKLHALEVVMKDSETGKKGLKELSDIFSYLDEFGLRSSVDFDLSLARGLNYYTGAIFEVKATATSMGSICGGGRYDDLTGIFGMPDVSGVGVSFGADRIYDVMNELKLFPAETDTGSRVLFANFGGQEERYSMKILELMHRQGISGEIYPEAAKMKKQFSYADDKRIPFVAIIGSEEMQNHSLSLKNMNTGEQDTLSVEQAIKKIKSYS
jgi:histidyl-tRNA synthetase